MQKLMNTCIYLFCICGILLLVVVYYLYSVCIQNKAVVELKYSESEMKWTRHAEREVYWRLPFLHYYSFRLLSIKACFYLMKEDCDAVSGENRTVEVCEQNEEQNNVRRDTRSVGDVHTFPWPTCERKAFVTAAYSGALWAGTQSIPHKPKNTSVWNMKLTFIRSSLYR